MTNLTQKKCEPCEGGTDPLEEDKIQEYLGMVKNWNVLAGNKITKNFEKDDFKSVIDFVNQIAEIAEAEGHHPDLLIHDYKKLTVTLSTHAIGGLSENDFILAAKIDQLHS